MSRRVLYFETGSGRGGSTRSLSTLVPALAAEGFEAVVACPSAGCAETLRRRGVEALPVGPGADWRSSRYREGGPAGALGFAARVALRVAREVAGLVRRTGAVLVHGNNDVNDDLAALAGAWWAGVPAVNHVRAIRGFTRKERLVARRLEAVVVPSEAVRAHCLAEGIAPARVRTVANPVSAPASTGGAGREDALVAVLSSLRPGKGLEVLLEAVPAVRARVPGARFAIAGGRFDATPGYAARLLERSREGGLAGAVEFLGHLEDPEGLLSRAVLAVAPSQVPEGFGRAAAEALRAGLPVVASRSGALAEVVRDGATGLLVEPGDAAGLARAVAGLLRDPALRDRMGRAAALDAARRFDPAAVARGLAAVYEEVLA
ncbi:MAG: glycosyltransferase family 4 protein [Planctomycetes bacterium]|nr:glycosyltransferase family 4 protein [Planctomycetota bacterium]